MVSSKIFLIALALVLIQVATAYYINEKNLVEDQTEKRILGLIDYMLERRHLNKIDQLEAKSNHKPKKCPPNKPIYNEVTGKCEKDVISDAFPNPGLPTGK